MEKILIVALAGLLAMGASADGHASTPMIMAENQSVENGIVSADKVVSGENGWFVVHRTGADKKPGPVVGHAPLRMGDNMDVAAILTEDVAAGDMLMLMVHSEAGGTERGTFEYTLGAKEDGPIKIDGKLAIAVITAN